MSDLPQTTPEQREPLYDDADSLISNGFLSHAISIGGTRLALRSLGPGDAFLLHTRVDGGDDEDWHVWTIASSVWMLNGYCLLAETNAIPQMARMIEGLPKSVKEILFTQVIGLFKRQAKALDAVESYCYETSSRFRWKSYGGQGAQLHTGIAGAEKLGTNYVQRMWTFFNEVEDQRIHDDVLWEGFKLTASATSPKGVQKIDQRDRQRRSDELQRRQKVQDRFYYVRMGVLRPDGVPVTADGYHLTGAKSVMELEDEMRRWVAGEEDWHDRVVTSYKKEVSRRYLQEKREKEARAAALRDGREVAGAQTMMVGYTPGQLAEILKHRQPGPPGVRSVSDGMNAARDYLYEKYIEEAPDQGNLLIKDGRVAVEEGKGLNAEVLRRLVPVTLRPGEEE